MTGEVTHVEGPPDGASFQALRNALAVADSVDPFQHGPEVLAAPTVVQAFRRDRLVGVAAGDPGLVAVGVHPDIRGTGLGTELLGRVCDARSEAGDEGVALWASRPQRLASPVMVSAREAMAFRLGFRLTRRLHRLTVRLPLAPPDIPGGRVLDTFGDDDAEEVVRVNNAAFDWHPERSGWTVEELRRELEEDWVDRAGFFVLRQGDALAGFCWTKLHTGEVPEGEIYVICADPAAHGRGIGRALTLAGLAHLSAQSHVGMLYVDEGNVAARQLYFDLGFRLDRVDSHYWVDFGRGTNVVQNIP